MDAAHELNAHGKLCTVPLGLFLSNNDIMYWSQAGI